MSSNLLSPTSEAARFRRRRATSSGIKAMDSRTVAALSSSDITELSDDDLRLIILGAQLSLGRIGCLHEEIDFLERETLEMLVYRVREQYRIRHPK